MKATKAGVQASRCAADRRPGVAALESHEELENNSGSNAGALVFELFMALDRRPEAAVRSTARRPVFRIFVSFVASR
jgi:hypothetical protein